jgi:hypothetical protein
LWTSFLTSGHDWTSLGREIGHEEKLARRQRDAARRRERRAAARAVAQAGGSNSTNGNGNAEITPAQGL